jgi:thioredoxin
MTDIQTVNARSFDQEVLHSGVPVLVDFTADWCPPCRTMSSILDQVAVDVGDKAKIVKVDTDADPTLAAAYGVSSIPSLYLIHHGKVVDGVLGVTTSQRLEEMIDRAESEIVEANE